MYVCLCNAVTDSQIAQAVRGGCRDVADLSRELGLGTGCGSCLAFTEEWMAENNVPNSPSVRAEDAPYYPA